jgi:hypothetical protein
VVKQCHRITTVHATEFHVALTKKGSKKVGKGQEERGAETYENNETKKPRNTYTSPGHVSYETGVLFLNNTISMSISLHSDRVS